MARKLFVAVLGTLQHMCTRYLKKIILVSMVLGGYVTFLEMYPSPQMFTTSSSDRLRDDVVSSANTKGYYNETGCVPHHHVFFLKSHKCGSTTVQNVLLRYGINNNLTFALGKGHTLGYPNKFKASMIEKSLLPTNGKVDIFAQHSRLNVAEHAKVLYEDTKWIAIVRDPVTLFASLFAYYELEKSYGFSLNQLKHQPLSKLILQGRGDMGRNQMMFEIGYSRNVTQTESQRAIENMDNLFDLVMISELMDESLILLRHLLCWSLHDVVVFTLNSRREETKPTLDSETVAVLRELNSADGALYKHFLARHKSAVLEFGARRMAKEVTVLCNLRNKYYKNCGVQTFEGRDPSLKVKMHSPLVNALVPSNTSDVNCIFLTQKEKSIVRNVKERQRIMIKNNRL